MSMFDEYPGYGGFYEPNPISSEPETAEPELTDMLPCLRLAHQAARNADTGRPNDPVEEMQFAMMYAAIAQAEALTRIAECMEQRLEDATLEQSARIWGG